MRKGGKRRGREGEGGKRRGREGEGGKRRGREGGRERRGGGGGGGGGEGRGEERRGGGGGGGERRGEEGRRRFSVPLIVIPSMRRSQMEDQVSQLIAERDTLGEELQQVVAAKKEVDDQLHDYTEETSQQVYDCRKSSVCVI